VRQANFKENFMKFKQTSIMLGVAALAALAAVPAAAQDKNGWYAGGSIGRTGASIDDNRITRGLAGQGLTTLSIDDRDTNHGYKVFGGYQFHPNFAVEAGYFDLGHFGYTARTNPAGSLSGDVRFKGVNLDLVGLWPITDKFSALARVGVTSERARGNFSSTGAVSLPFAASTSERATNVKFGAGVMYDFTPSLGVRLEAERYRVNDSVGNKGHVDMVSLGLVYRFGATPQPVRVVAPSPVYVAPAPAPAPAPMIIAPAPPPAPAVIAPPPPEPVRAPKPYRN
jgi:OmpA-OmpF porin, OOP family